MEKKFRKMNLDERLEELRSKIALNEADILAIKNPLAITKFEDLNRMIENAIGIYPIPLGIATNFLINNKKYLIPMATEEPSVIARCELCCEVSRCERRIQMQDGQIHHEGTNSNNFS